MPMTYPFDHPHDVEPHGLTHLLGGKGAQLAGMVTKLGMPVPPGFTVTTEAWRRYDGNGWPGGLDDEVRHRVGEIERAFSRGLGDPRAPLLVSVRSGAPISMPGMMDTVLNLGVGEATLPGLSDWGGALFAMDTYRRFLRGYIGIVLERPEMTSAPAAVALDVRSLRSECDRLLSLYEEHTGTPFPQDPWEQLRAAIEAVWRSWRGAKAVAYRRREGIPDDLGTAVNVQAMVFGNKDDRSATGVVFTRDPRTGDRRRCGDLLFGAQGEDVVSGALRTQELRVLRERLPDVADELERHLHQLEAHYRDMCDVEFTVESGRLWILQVRPGKRSARAAVRIAVDLTFEGVITRGEALEHVPDKQITEVLASTGISGHVDVLGHGLAASPGTATGRLCFTADDCLNAADNGETVILVRRETSPEDVHGMQVAGAVLTTHGGLVSHAAVVARGWGIPAVVSLRDATIDGASLTVSDMRLTERDVITVDGGTGRVYLGVVEPAALRAPPELDALLSWREAASADGPSASRPDRSKARPA